VDCDHEDIESTRAELYGAVALYTIVLVLMKMFSLLSGKVELYGDNKDSLCKNPIDTSTISFPRFFRPNVDLKLQIQHMRATLRKIEIIPLHLKGHQDDDEDFVLEQAPLEVQCNIAMDKESKNFLKCDQGPLAPTYKATPLPVQKSYLKINDAVIQNNMDHHVQLHFFGHKLEQ